MQIKSIRYQIISGNEISVKDIKEAVQLDQLSYDKCYQGRLSDCIKWFNINCDIYIMIRDLNIDKIIGYINIMPISQSCYNKIRSGNLIDIEIKTDDILQYIPNTNYYIYFSSIVIHPNYRNSKVLKLLLDSFVNKINQLKNKKIYIKKILSDAVTTIGEKICQKFGMNKIIRSKHNSSIYEKILI